MSAPQYAWAVKVRSKKRTMTTGWLWVRQLDDADPVPEWHARRLFEHVTAEDVAEVWRNEGFDAQVVRVTRTPKGRA